MSSPIISVQPTTFVSVTFAQSPGKLFSAAGRVVGSIFVLDVSVWVPSLDDPQWVAWADETFIFRRVGGRDEVAGWYL
jgi:hypothetical protein